jgi:hypothetical protein
MYSQNDTQYFNVYKRSKITITFNYFFITFKVKKVMICMAKTIILLKCKNIMEFIICIICLYIYALNM